MVTESQGPRPPELPEDAATPIQSLTDQIMELSTITGGLAHEIRNSLSTLRMNLQLLDEDWRQAQTPSDDDPGDQHTFSRRNRKRIGLLLNESRRLERILEDFLHFVSQRELKRERCDLNTLLEELVEFYRPQAEAHQVRLKYLPMSDPLICEVDINLIKQAVLNLMINAQQVMTDGGHLTIQTSDVDNKTARIDVIDTGPGIDPEQLGAIFQAYYSSRKGGTGLGLTTAQQVIRKHGGRIHVHSELSKGTCFTILLPRTHPEPENS